MKFLLVVVFLAITQSVVLSKNEHESIYRSVTKAITWYEKIDKNIKEGIWFAEKNSSEKISIYGIYELSERYVMASIILSKNKEKWEVESRTDILITEEKDADKVRVILQAFKKPFVNEKEMKQNIIDKNPLGGNYLVAMSNCTINGTIHQIVVDTWLHSETDYGFSLYVNGMALKKLVKIKHK